MLIQINRSDGGVSIMRLLGGTVDDEIAKWEKQSGFTHVSHTEISETELREKSFYRDAWRHDKGLVVDMDAAREIHREKLRALRAQKLAALDVEYQRADEDGDGNSKRAISTLKQALRDATSDPMIDAAKTPDELRLAIPDILK